MSVEELPFLEDVKRHDLGTAEYCNHYMYT
jgi:hypothetical protein